MRGKAIEKLSFIPDDGITPAYAGKSHLLYAGFPFSRDHPRLCGEKSSVGLCSDKMTGSPPPMRGKAEEVVRGHIKVRITPAYAGKRKDMVKSNALNRDHPRLCGEKSVFHVDMLVSVGSPPPMRGKVVITRKMTWQSRITPAYAGKSCFCGSSLDSCRDHPRLCGEKDFVLPVPVISRGSPPPMRGKENWANDPQMLRRITPAYAGKRSALRAVSKVSEDHPRLCGEKIKFDQCHVLCLGSPPPMRGKANNVRQIFTQYGITPAYAGKRICCRCTHACMRDHPRLCGEKICLFAFCHWVAGSPPPMRGKVLLSPERVAKSRITPAYAGKS